MPLNILVNGAGICGPALATLLVRANQGHNITVVERSPELRTGGQQIDLRAQGIPVMKKLGLLETVRGRTVGEEGIAFVDTTGKERARFGVNDSGKGEQSFTSEFEIMRGDLVDVLYQGSLDAEDKARQGGSCKGSLKYEFGKYATSIEQEEKSTTVSVQFSDGSSGVYDLVVGADGQSSRTRRMIFETEGLSSKDMFKEVGLYVAYFLIPKSESDKKQKKAYVCITEGSKLLSMRTGCPAGTQVCFGIMGDVQDLEAVQGKPVAEQKAAWRKKFEGSGWEVDRFLEGMDHTDDFYMQVVGQVKMEKWSKGRVALVGDAGYCPSPITGLGTTASLVGAYVLAGELARHGDDVAAALEAYGETLKPFVTNAQKLAPGAPGLLYPKSWWGVKLLYTFISGVSILQLDKLFTFLTPTQTAGWQIPEYPELNLDE